MGDIAQRGNRLTAAKGGRIGKFGGGRTNLLEELGRVEAEPSNRNRRAEISRVHGELNRGYAKGGRAGHAAGAIVKGGAKIGKRFLDFIKTGKHVDKKGVKTNVPKAAERLTGKPHVDRVKKAAGGWTKHIPERKGPRGGHPGFTKESMFEHAGGGEKGKPHSSKEGRIAAGERNMRRQRERMKERLKKWKEDNPPRAKLPSPGRPSRPKQPWEKIHPIQNGIDGKKED